MDLLRQYLIAPYEAGNRQLLDRQISASQQPLHQQTNAAHHHITKPNLEQQSHQQFQQRLQQQPQPQEPTLTRDQVLKGLALYPDILTSILGMRDSVFLQQNLQSPASESSPSHPDLYASTRGYCSYTPLESNQLREATRAVRDTKTADKVNRASIPTSPRAGRYAKGQRLQRGQYGACAMKLPLKRKAENLSLTRGAQTTDLGHLNKKVRKQETSHEGQRDVGDSMGSSRGGFNGQVQDGTKTYVDECVHLTNLAEAIKTNTTKPITLTNRITTSLSKSNTNTPHKLHHRQPSKKAQRKTLTTLLATPKPYDTIPYTTSVSTHGPGIPSSAHRKKHQTCFAWYHGVCALRGKKCRFLHTLTQPISFVQPPEGFVHGVRRQKRGDGDGENVEDRGDASGDEQAEQAKQEVTCTLDWCPGDWLWDHGPDDTDNTHDEDHDEEISNEQGDKNFGLEE